MQSITFVQPFSPQIHTFAAAAAAMPESSGRGVGLPLTADFFLQK